MGQPQETESPRKGPRSGDGLRRKEKNRTEEPGLGQWEVQVISQREVSHGGGTGSHTGGPWSPNPGEPTLVTKATDQAFGPGLLGVARPSNHSPFLPVQSTLSLYIC